MCRGGKYKNGNPKRASRFICCKCLKENQIGSGIQRANQREKGHIKDLTCINPGCNGDITKNIEVRYCDSFDEMMEYAEELHNEYYWKGGLIGMIKTVGELRDALLLIDDDMPIVMFDNKSGDSKEMLFAEVLEDDDPDVIAFTICVE